MESFVKVLVTVSVAELRRSGEHQAWNVKDFCNADSAQFIFRLFGLSRRVSSTHWVPEQIGNATW